MSDARTAYERVVREIRQRISDGRAIGAMTVVARELGTDYALVNRAFAQLAGEGLVLVEHGRKTTMPERQLWEVAFRSAPVAAAEAEEVSQRLAVAAAVQPMMSAPIAVHEAPGVLVARMVVESADAGGAVTAALPVAREALGPLPVTGITVAEAG